MFKPKRSTLLPPTIPSANGKISIQNFVSLLPQEIVGIIFSHLPFDELLRHCPEVSKTWHNFIMNWGPLWKEPHYLTNPPPHYFRYMLSANLRCLSVFRVGGYLNEEKMVKLLQMLVDKKCENIRKLELYYCRFPSSVFLRTLGYIGNQMTHLRLDECEIDLETMSQVIQYTQNTLIELSILNGESSNSWTQPWILPSTFPSKLKLRSISLTMPRLHRPIAATIYGLLIAACPDLRHIYLFHRDNDASGLFRILRAHCPLLESICVDATLFMDEVNPFYDNPQMQKETTRGRLREFAIKCLKETPDEYIEAALDNQQETLRILRLEELPEPCRIPSFVSQHAWPQLREVSLKDSPEFEEDHLCAFFEKAPLLEVINLSRVGRTTDRVLEVMSKLKHLEGVDVSHTSVTGVGVRMLLEQCRTLIWLGVNGCYSIEPDVIRYAQDLLGQCQVYDSDYDLY
ncbi:uncharacterized protein BYT42DRAFT_571395 [Radiomyces spectabilis]|uniref:uncharacterized protein n=1 Tax=Radiomyces spectabilis TaxID=64574 RepID=UPI002220C877|nr:uncharacterized protein BYT42DRAFT_571395 [Radiomyces spectabilis]KAI8377730.1 hypothetical protein BYT42DRAFT_571395 [Radiomyces spectabilis]